MVKAVNASGSPETAPAPAATPAAPPRAWWARAARFLLRDRPELLLSPLALVLLVYLWYVVTSAGLVAPVLLPSPGAVGRAL
ncbi:MAG TPA: ABC transporter permease, partial [Actinomycetota bacterium]